MLPGSTSAAGKYFESRCDGGDSPGGRSLNREGIGLATKVCMGLKPFPQRVAEVPKNGGVRPWFIADLGG